MNNQKLNLLLLIQVLLFITFLHSAFSSNKDAAILLRVKKSQLTDPDGKLDDWLESTQNAPCNWTGISCDAATRDVVAINLSGFDISGDFPADFCRISTLRDLDLSNNYVEKIMPDVHSLVNEFVMKLSKRKIEGSKATAQETAELLRTFISLQKLPHSNQAGALIDAVKAVGEKLIAAKPVELAIGNIVRRVLHIIREEDDSLTAAVGGLNLATESNDIKQDDRPVLSASVVAAASRNALRPPALQTLLEDIPHSSAVSHPPSSGGDSEGKSKSADKNSVTKHNVIEAVNELIQEISTCHEQIAEQAVEHIHQNEVILTLGSSRTVTEFLFAAKEKKRSFRVFVAEGAPRYQGHALAKELAGRGLQTTVITDSAVFAMISRVNMVIVGAHAVMANGGVIAPVGMYMVALAAQRHAVPFVVLAGVHKLCPLYPHNPEILLNELKSPSELLNFGEFSDCLDFGSGTGSPLIHVVNPAFDYVPPNLVSLFITDTGGHNPSYMYRLIADYYSPDDLVVRRKSAS